LLSRSVVVGELARIIILIGVVLTVIGLLLLALPRFPFLGRLPGDILIKKEHFTFYFPLATSIIISIIISMILYLINRFR
jgi:uncharacterized protein HemY